MIFLLGVPCVSCHVSGREGIGVHSSLPPLGRHGGWSFQGVLKQCLCVCVCVACVVVNVCMFARCRFLCLKQLECKRAKERGEISQRHRTTYAKANEFITFGYESRLPAPSKGIETGLAGCFTLCEC